VPELKVGYARVSTAAQDLTAQWAAMSALGVDPRRPRHSRRTAHRGVRLDIDGV